MTERDVLRKTKEVLLERGWRNDGSFGPSDGSYGPVCLMGACGVALTENQLEYTDRAYDDDPLLQCLAALVPEQSRFRVLSVAQWNDTQARDLGDVINLLDRALASLETEAPTPELVA